MDLTAFEAGTLQEILAPEGTTVQIGQPVARIGSGDATASDRRRRQPNSRAPEPARLSEPAVEEEAQTRRAEARQERCRARGQEAAGRGGSCGRA